MSVNYVERSRFVDRPRLLSVAQTDETIRSAHLIGAKKLGLNFFSEAPSKQVYGPNEVVDHLSHSNTEVLPLPNLLDVLKDTYVSKEDRELIEAAQALNDAALERYQVDVSSTNLERFGLLVGYTLKMKNSNDFSV